MGICVKNLFCLLCRVATCLHAPHASIRDQIVSSIFFHAVRAPLFICVFFFSPVFLSAWQKTREKEIVKEKKVSMFFSFCSFLLLRTFHYSSEYKTSCIIRSGQACFKHMAINSVFSLLLIHFFKIMWLILHEWRMSLFIIIPCLPSSLFSLSCNQFQIPAE